MSTHQVFSQWRPPSPRALQGGVGYDPNTISICAPRSPATSLSLSGAVISNASLVRSAKETICVGGAVRQWLSGDFFWPAGGSETWVCGILSGNRAYSEGFIFWFTKSFAPRNEVSTLGHLVSVPGCEVHISRWMLFAWMPAPRAHAGRVQGKGGGL